MFFILIFHVGGVSSSHNYGGFSILIPIFFFLISKENSFIKRRQKSDSRYTAYVRYTNLYTRHQKRPKTYKRPTNQKAQNLTMIPPNSILIPICNDNSSSWDFHLGGVFNLHEVFSSIFFFFFLTGKFLSPLGLEPRTSHKPSPSLYHLSKASRARYFPS